MDKTLEQVGEFRKAFKSPYVNKPTIPDEDRKKLCINLIKKEFEELIEALHDNNIVEIADALVDLKYVVNFAIHELGMQECFEELFDEVQRSHMSILDENGNTVPHPTIPNKIGKFHLYSPPNLKPIIDNYIDV